VEKTRGSASTRCKKANEGLLGTKKRSVVMSAVEEGVLTLMNTSIDDLAEEVGDIVISPGSSTTSKESTQSEIAESYQELIEQLELEIAEKKATLSKLKITMRKHAKQVR